MSATVIRAEILVVRARVIPTADTLATVADTAILDRFNRVKRGRV